MNKIKVMHEQSLKTKSMSGEDSMFLTNDQKVANWNAYVDAKRAVGQTGQGMADPSVFGLESGGLNPTTPTVNTGWDSMQGKGGLALGVANTGLGLMNFFDSKKTAKIQRDLMKQQLASNTETMAQKRADRANINAAFNSGGQGLKI